MSLNSTAQLMKQIKQIHAGWSEGDVVQHPCLNVIFDALRCMVYNILLSYFCII